MTEVITLKGEEWTYALYSLAEAMFRESRFSKLHLDTEKLFRHCQDILFNGSFLACGAVDGGVLCGMCIGVCGQILPFTGDRVATQHYLYLAPNWRGGDTAPRLIQAFTEEAKRQGAEDVVFSNGYGGGFDKVGRLFEHCGLKLIGGVYTLGD